MRRLDVPTIVIHGEEDPLIRVEHGYDTAGVIPGAKLTTIPGMGHDLPSQLWPRFTELITTHVKSTEASTDDNKAA